MPKAALDTHAEVRKLEETGCSEEQAVATVDLVSRAPVNAQIVTRFDGLEVRFDGLEVRFDGLESRVENIEANMATKSDLRVLRAETREDFAALHAETRQDFAALRAETREGIAALRADTREGLASLRAEMSRMLWIQGGVLGTLILGLATIMLGLLAL